MDYALGMREFLESWHLQTKNHDPIAVYDQDMINRMFNSNLQGRSGYIRQAYTFIFPQTEYSKFSLFVDGINAQFPDIDFYDATR